LRLEGLLALRCKLVTGGPFGSVQQVERRC
jgi:hypothetical protein